MKTRSLKRISGLLLKTIPIVLILVQFSLFVSFHKSASRPSLSHHDRSPDVLVSQQSSASRSVFGPGDTSSLSDIGLLPYNFTLKAPKTTSFRIVLQPFHKGGAALALTTINAP